MLETRGGTMLPENGTRTVTGRGEMASLRTLC